MVLSFVWLPLHWDLVGTGLVGIGKEVISLQSLCCVHVGPPTWAEFGQVLFLEPYLSLPQLLMSLFLPNSGNLDLNLSIASPGNPIEQ